MSHSLGSVRPSIHGTGSWKSGTARLSSPRTRPPALPSAESFLRVPPTEVSPPAGHVQAWFCLLAAAMLWPSGAPPCMQRTLIQAPCPSCLLVLIPEILTIGEGRNIDWLVSTFVWMSYACETSDGTPTHTHTSLSANPTSFFQGCVLLQTFLPAIYRFHSSQTGISVFRKHRWAEISKEKLNFHTTLNTGDERGREQQCWLSSGSVLILPSSSQERPGPLIGTEL